MLSMLTTEEFAAWFRSLDDQDAEEVATGIDLIEKLGPERHPPSSSELLLWYQSQPEHPLLHGQSGAGLIAHAQRAVPAQSAAHAAARIAFIAARTRRWRRAGLANASALLLEQLEEDHRGALEALGLEDANTEPPSQGLRELDLREREPGLRVLYGVDIPGGRALLILGERLDGCAYGPSVRRALSSWQRFLSSGAETGALAMGSRR